MRVPNAAMQLIWQKLIYAPSQPELLLAIGAIGRDRSRSRSSKSRIPQRDKERMVRATTANSHADTAGGNGLCPSELDSFRINARTS